MNPEELAQKFAQIDAELSSIRGSLPASVEELVRTKLRLEELVKAASDAQIKADEEARRAARAKEYCEEHSTFISQKKGQVEVELAAVSATKAACEEIARGLSANRADAEDTLKLISTAKDSVSQAQNWIAQNQPQVEGLFQSITANKNLSDSALQETQKFLADTKSAMAESKAAMDETIRIRTQSTQTLEKITEANAQADAHARNTQELKTATETDRATAAERLKELTGITEDLKARHAEILEHNRNLATLNKQYSELNKKVEGLLPHAASAGLASAFREQKDRFKRPQKWWLFTSVASIIVLFAIAVPEFWNEITAAGKAAEGTVSWDSILRHFMHRLPLVFPLVWLAIYSSRNYTMAVRMEEDYAYKEAVSTAFEGYKREMGGIPSSGPDGESPLITLCANVLTAISQRPGRIYEGKHQDVTPLTPMLNAMQTLTGKKADETKTE